MVRLWNLTEDIPTVSDSPAFRAIDWMASVDTLPPTQQRYALVVLYYATGGEEWWNQYGFLNATSHECSNWNGVSPLDGSDNGVLCGDDEDAVEQLLLSTTTCRWTGLWYVGHES